MAYKLRTGPCQDCGVHVERRRAAIDPHRCIRCSIAVATQAATEMRNKSGPAWDKWLASRPKALERQAAAAQLPSRGRR